MITLCYLFHLFSYLLAQHVLDPDPDPPTTSHTFIIPTPTTPHHAENTNNFVFQGSFFQFQCDIPPDWFSEVSRITPDVLWPNGRVVYELQDNLSSNALRVLNSAVEEFHTKTCIRFEPRFTEKQTAYLRIEVDPEFCAIANFCYKGTVQYLKFGPFCALQSIVTHLIGHALCLPHEHERPDRDAYVDYRNCTPADEIPPKHHFDSRGYPYDYGSQMHYSCGLCAGGMPKLPKVYRCGQDAGDRLGVLDADKINDMYHCQGCFRHRWRSTANLTEADKRAMIPFGYNHRDKQPLYLCRAFANGEIIPGKFRMDRNTCYVAVGWWYQEMNVKEIRENVQVFTLPPATNTEETITQKHATYKMVPSYDVKPSDVMVPAGATVIGDPIYATMAEVGDEDRETSIGKMYWIARKYASFVYEHKVEKVTDYDILVCKTGSVY